MTAEKTKRTVSFPGLLKSGESYLGLTRREAVDNLLKRVDWVPEESQEYRDFSKEIQEIFGEVKGIRMGRLPTRYAFDPIETRGGYIIAFDREGSEEVLILKKHRGWSMEYEVEGSRALHALGVDAPNVRYLKSQGGYFAREFRGGLVIPNIEPERFRDREFRNKITSLLGKNDAASLAIAKGDFIGNMRITFDEDKNPVSAYQYDFTTAFSGIGHLEEGTWEERYAKALFLSLDRLLRSAREHCDTDGLREMTESYTSALTDEFMRIQSTVQSGEESLRSLFKSKDYHRSADKKWQKCLDNINATDIPKVADHIKVISASKYG